VVWWPLKRCKNFYILLKKVRRLSYWYFVVYALIFAVGLFGWLYYLNTYCQLYKICFGPVEYELSVDNTFLVFYEGFATPASFFNMMIVCIFYTSFPTYVAVCIPKHWNKVISLIIYAAFLYLSFCYAALAVFMFIFVSETLLTFFPSYLLMTLVDELEQPKNVGKEIKSGKHKGSGKDKSE